MELAGWTLFLVIVPVVVAIAGGKVSFGPSGLSIDTGGIRTLIQEVREAKSIKPSPEAKAPKGRNPVELPSVAILWVDDDTVGKVFKREALSKRADGVFDDPGERLNATEALVDQGRR